MVLHWRSSGLFFRSLKQLAITQTPRYDSNYYVEMTFFDKINIIRQECNILNSFGETASCSNVTKAYSGLPNKESRDIIQTAKTHSHPSTSYRHNWRDIQRWTSWYTSENKTYQFRGGISEEEVLGMVHCRVNWKFINITSIKSATNFMNAEADKEVLAHINELHRAKYILYEKNFKPVQHEIISHQYMKSMKVLLEGDNFTMFTNPDSWPVEMEKIKNNLLWTTLFDKEIDDHENKKLSSHYFLRRTNVITRSRKIKDMRGLKKH